jgi:hypothetical protein
MKRLPKGFRRGHTDNIACPHRDVTCCAECAAKYPELVDIYGRHFWIPDPVERADIIEMQRTGKGL